MAFLYSIKVTKQSNYRKQHIDRCFKTYSMEVGIWWSNAHTRGDQGSYMPTRLWQRRKVIDFVLLVEVRLWIIYSYVNNISYVHVLQLSTVKQREWYRPIQNDERARADHQTCYAREVSFSDVLIEEVNSCSLSRDTMSRFSL